MVKVESNNALILKQTFKKLYKEPKVLALYTILMSYQQQNIYFETITEIQKEIKKMSYKTLQKYLKILIKYNLIKKTEGIYIINYYS